MAFGQVLELVLRGFRMVSVFSGRDTRAQFWSYAIFLYLAVTAIQMAITVPLIYGVMERSIDLAMTNPELLAAEAGKGGLPTPVMEMMSDLDRLMPWSIAAGAGVYLLLAAAVTRRLHDRGRTGAWGLIALPPTALTIYLMPQIFVGYSSTGFDYGTSLLLAFNNLLGITVFIVLVVMLASAGTKGPNRYGEDPLLPQQP